MRIFWELLQDASSGQVASYGCPRCGRRNALLPSDHAHECICGDFILDIGEPFGQFYEKISKEMAGGMNFVAA